MHIVYIQSIYDLPLFVCTLVFALAFQESIS